MFITHILVHTQVQKIHTYWSYIGHWCHPEGCLQGPVANSHSPCPMGVYNSECSLYSVCLCVSHFLEDRKRENQRGGQK